MVLEQIEQAVPVMTAKMKRVNSQKPHRFVVAVSPPPMVDCLEVGSQTRMRARGDGPQKCFDALGGLK